MRMCVFEDAGVTRLAPLALTRPTFDLRCGALSLLERQRGSLAGDEHAEVGVLIRPELEDLFRLESPGVPVNDRDWLAEGNGDLLLVNGRWLTLTSVERADGPEVGLIGDQVAYVNLAGQAVGDLDPRRLPWWLENAKATLPTRQVRGEMIDYPWNLVDRNGAALEHDFRAWQRAAAPRFAGKLPSGVALTGPAERLMIDPTARVEPFTFVDTSNGPVLIDRGAIVQAFSRLEGPCYVGPDTHILAGRVKGSSFGPQCRIGGEVESSIVHGHSNKAHDGFLGHSYLGEWVNLGAGTYTSDLRNDYGLVSMNVAGHKVETGLLKVGSFLGDHTKTSIGTLFNTGSLIGPFGQLVTSGELLPRQLPAFCQVANGRMVDRTDLGRMFATAATAMGRRKRLWTEVHAEFYLGLYERTAGERLQMLRDNEARRQRRAV